MPIRKRASGASLNVIREDASLRVILQAGLVRSERDIQDASDFGDISDKVERLYERKNYIEKLLAHEGKLRIVAD